MEIGNWKIKDESITWIGPGLQRFVIPMKELTKTVTAWDGTTKYYEWILLATDEDWLTQDDLYDLNYAFVFAAAKYAFPFHYSIFDETLAEQYERLDGEDDEDPGF